MAQTGKHKGLEFGIFLAPFHRLGENPTLAIERDIELIEWLDQLGYDEAWIGEHHSAGWEIIASPEVFIAAAAERTQAHQARLGRHQPAVPPSAHGGAPLRAARPHDARPRMLGCGPGALPSDAYMMGIDPSTQRDRMDEALDAIMRAAALRGAGHA